MIIHHKIRSMKFIQNYQWSCQIRFQYDHCGNFMNYVCFRFCIYSYIHICRYFVPDYIYTISMVLVFKMSLFSIGFFICSWSSVRYSYVYIHHSNLLSCVPIQQKLLLRPDKIDLPAILQTASNFIMMLFYFNFWLVCKLLQNFWMTSINLFQKSENSGNE